MKKTLSYLGIVIILGVGVFFVITPPPFGYLPFAGEEIRTNESLPISASLKLENGQEIGLRVADSAQERQLGLSYFKSLPQDQGMLFLFDKSDIYPFWMKDMNFPIDIIWLKSLGAHEYEIVYTAHNVSPESYPQSINPDVISDTVIEVNKGLATVYNLTPGKKMWITFKK